MSPPFHVQGRLIQRQGTVVVRDETRRMDADSHDDALSIAHVLSDEGFTVWVWAVDGGASEVWDLVERIEPAVVAGLARPGRADLRHGRTATV